MLGHSKLFSALKKPLALATLFFTSSLYPLCKFSGDGGVCGRVESLPLLAPLEYSNEIGWSQGSISSSALILLSQNLHFEEAKNWLLAYTMMPDDKKKLTERAF